MRILLAEDSAFYRLMFEAMLAEWGYEVWSASDGEEAWQQLRRPGAPRLALIDWMMPKADGLELCRRIRSAPALKDMYVVMITVKQDRESSLLAFESGADDFILKPFDLGELRARLLVAGRTVERQSRLAARIGELEACLAARDAAPCVEGRGPT
jgi:DNA-binding response OmpR family regulator